MNKNSIDNKEIIIIGIITGILFGGIVFTGIMISSKVNLSYAYISGYCENKSELIYNKTFYYGKQELKCNIVDCTKEFPCEITYLSEGRQ